MGSRNHSLSGLRFTMVFFKMVLCLALFCFLGNVGSHGLYPVMYSGLIPPSTPLMTGNFVSRKIHPNQEQIMETFNEVWGNVGGGSDEVEGVKISFEELEDNSGLK